MKHLVRHCELSKAIQDSDSTNGLLCSARNGTTKC